MNITAIKRGFIFQFCDDVTAKGEFAKTASAAGIILNSSFDESAKQPRWVSVIAAGPDCDETVLHAGAKVLLPALRWTAASKLEGQKIWKSDETQVVAYTDGDAIVPCNEHVIFKQIPRERTSTSAAGLLVISGSSEDTPSGIVSVVSGSTDPELTVGTKIYYDDANFADTFDHNGTQYAFIKEDSILAYEPQ